MRLYTSFRLHFLRSARAALVDAWVGVLLPLVPGEALPGEPLGGALPVGKPGGALPAAAAA